MAKRHMKTFSTSLISREMQTKTTMRYHLMPVRMAIIKKSRNSKYWEVYGEKGTLLNFWWEFKNKNDRDVFCYKILKLLYGKIW